MGLAHHKCEFSSHAKYLQARQELLLKVQCKVLPRHGFEGSSVGVMDMMAALGAFVNDEEVVTLGREINDLLGIAMPPMSWHALSKQCNAIRGAVNRERDGEVGQRRRCGMKGTPLPAPAPIPRSWMDCRDIFDASMQSGDLALAPGIPAFHDALPFARWPSPIPPLSLFIAGTWSMHQPRLMQWAAGLFMYPIKVGESGQEKFWILQDGKHNRLIYPSIADANHLDEYTICGPDAGSAGKSWHIGKGYPDAEDGATPNMRLSIVAVINAEAKVKMVGWQPF